MEFISQSNLRERKDERERNQERRRRKYFGGSRVTAKLYSERICKATHQKLPGFGLVVCVCGYNPVTNPNIGHRSFTITAPGAGNPVQIKGSFTVLDIRNNISQD